MEQANLGVMQLIVLWLVTINTVSCFLRWFTLIYQSLFLQHFIHNPMNLVGPNVFFEAVLRYSKFSNDSYSAPAKQRFFVTPRKMMLYKYSHTAALLKALASHPTGSHSANSCSPI